MKLFQRMKELKATGKWSLRQMVPKPEPKRQKTHHDFLLEEMVIL